MSARGGNRIDFLVVGTPRSGTTLLQRLVRELPGVGMPPETHFFSEFAVDLLERERFPIGERRLRDEIERFGALPWSTALSLDEDAIVARLGGRCDSALELFGAIVNQLAGPCELVGEKTPDHLAWWRPLSRSDPDLRFVAVVRDPRAVVASNLAAPWARWDVPVWGHDGHVAAAARWRWQQRRLAAMSEILGPARCVVVRYEDMVSDVAGTKSRLAEFLGVRAPEDGPGEGDDAPPEGQPPLFLPWEPWKREATGPVVSKRIRGWEKELTPRQIEQVTALCRPVMRRFGYEDERPGAFTASLRLVALGPRLQRRLRGLWLNERRHQARIDAARLGAVPGALAAADRPGSPSATRTPPGRPGSTS